MKKFSFIEDTDIFLETIKNKPPKVREKLYQEWITSKFKSGELVIDEDDEDLIFPE